MKHPPFWNIPNLLTLARIAVIPVLVWVLWDEPNTKWDMIACAIFVVAQLTDIIDGWLARRWNLMTPMGAYLDPLADKLMVTTVLVMLIPLGRAPAWMVVLLLCREVAITGLRGIASQEGIVMAASSLGKLKTAYMGTALGFLLWHHRTLDIDVHSTGIALLWITLFCSIGSGLHYFREFVRKSRVISL